MSANNRFWHGKRVLITGHTGFKGSWLSIWLKLLGADVIGLGLIPSTNPSLFDLASLNDRITSVLGDIRDYSLVKHLLTDARPEIIFHMAAQPLVGQSYVDPIETYSTNVLGTVHILEAARLTQTVIGIVNVTTDKCYENKEWDWGYRENDRLGGHDPYSSSKACAEFVSSSYTKSFFSKSSTALATARAGNVIGGGDWTTGRLVPDILHSFETGELLLIRNPQSIRPWQHVLESLSGYLLLGQRLFENGQAYAQSWNFGPNDFDAKPVSWVVDTMMNHWGISGHWRSDTHGHPHEANCLKLDISKAQNKLGWMPRWTLEKALINVVDWHRAYLNSDDMFEVCKKQIENYTLSAFKLGV